MFKINLYWKINKKNIFEKYVNVLLKHLIRKNLMPRIMFFCTFLKPLVMTVTNFCTVNVKNKCV